MLYFAYGSNLNHFQMKKRCKDSKIIIGGDFFQSDINGKSGFKPMFDKFDDDDAKEMGIHTFSFNEGDIVRSKILKFIIKRLEETK